MAFLPATGLCRVLGHTSAFPRFCLRNIGEYSMQRNQDSLVPFAEAFSGLDGPLKALRDTSPRPPSISPALTK